MSNRGLQSLPDSDSARLNLYCKCKKMIKEETVKNCFLLPLEVKGLAETAPCHVPNFCDDKQIQEFPNIPTI